MEKLHRGLRISQRIPHGDKEEACRRDFRLAVCILPALCSFETMAFSASLKLVVYALLASTGANVWANAQVALPCSNSTAINGTPFPSLIDATTEDLIGGLESGLFTSVDLVNAYVARIMEVGPNPCLTYLTTPHILAQRVSGRRERLN